MLVGIAFAFGWTPCIGPILGGILTIAGSREPVSEGMLLLAVYSAGLGVPFLLTSLAVDKFFAASARIRKHYRTIELVAGGLLIVHRRADLHEQVHGAGQGDRPLAAVADEADLEQVPR